MIYLVSGKALSGKGEVARTMANVLEAKRLAFALPLKKLAIEHLGVTIQECYNSKEEALDEGWEAPDGVYGKSHVSRVILQGLGTILKQRIAESVWVDLLVIDIKEEILKHEFPPDFVVADWRYPIELEVLMKSYGTMKWLGSDQMISFPKTKTVRVVRPGGPPIEAGSLHPSETSLSDDGQYDLVVYNDSTLTDLNNKVTSWLKKGTPPATVL